MTKINTKTAGDIDEEVLSKIVLTGDITGLNDLQKLQYINAMCARYGLDPITRPFDILITKGKARLYANRSTTDQIREKKQLSSRIVETKQIGDIYTVVVEVTNGERGESSTGVVSTEGLFGDELANAYMKAETKAKRRATLAYLGLAILDESEVESIPGATTAKFDTPPAQEARDIEELYGKLVNKLESGREINVDAAIEAFKGTKYEENVRKLLSETTPRTPGTVQAPISEEAQVVNSSIPIPAAFKPKAPTPGQKIKVIFQGGVCEFFYNEGLDKNGNPYRNFKAAGDPKATPFWGNENSMKSSKEFDQILKAWQVQQRGEAGAGEYADEPEGSDVIDADEVAKQLGL